MKNNHFFRSNGLHTIDLSINFSCNLNAFNFIRKFFGIEILGICQNSLVKNNNKSILATRKVYTPQNNKTNLCFYLHYLNFFGYSEENFSKADVFTIRNFSNIKSLLKKLAGKNIGIEILVSDLRQYENYKIGKWFYEAKYLYSLCSRYDHQFILSSGSDNLFELVSKKSFNSILEKMDIPTPKYWNDLNNWLNLRKREIINDTL